MVPLTALVGCDHVTKFIAKTELEGQPPRRLVGSLLGLQYVENRDVAFNLLAWVPEPVRAPLLLAFGALTVIALLAFLLRRQGRPRAAGTSAALLLILAGGVGNYADRLFRGYVVDFIRLPYWPVFNVADMSVTAGVALLAWTALRARAHSPPPPQPT